MNMHNWIEQMIYTERKKPLPVLTFPAVQYLYVTTRELVADSSHQAIGMRAMDDNYDMPAIFGYMDLSVEAEAFGAYTVYTADEVPTIIGKLVANQDDADALQVPEVGAGRTGTTVEGIKKAQKLIKDKPIFAQCIGPFSLAGRLLNVNDIMLQCYEDPELVHTVLRKATAFIIKYAQEFKNEGANGIMIAEPLAGLLSPQLIDEFSTAYVKEIVEAVQDRNFITFYHNCGTAVPFLLDSIIDTGCLAFHFGESVNLRDVLEKIPRNFLVLGNVSPAQVFNTGTVEHTRIETLKLLNACGEFNNFIASSGCDIPPNVDLDNVVSFFKTVEGFYYRLSLRNAIS